MALTAGARFGQYEILESIGAGGMGEVYRARDTKLKRNVALKVLPENFAGDPMRMARFQREAEVLASLNHPNIAQIYGVEERALAMELVEGESPRGPMPYEDAWKIAAQMAAGLAYAHEKGVVHRDLKPANIKVTPEGAVKLLDFGLAKAYREQPESAAGDSSLAPTETLSATLAGTIMGTAAYMAPEQAKGKPVDPRADIWSWGVVLYELLTGESPFRGENAADTLAAVIHKPPDLERVPAPARKVLRRCLEKDPRKRLRDIGDAEDLLESGAAAAVAAPSRPRLSAGIIALLTVVLGALAFVHFRERPEARPVLQYTVAAAETARNVSSFAISPDGRSLAIAASGEGEPLIWVRSLDSLATQPLAGTEGAAFPFWSPDSRDIGFFSHGKLQKISVTGGTPQILCEVTGFLGGAWSRDGVIVFGRAGGLSRVAEAGGVPVSITEAGATSHRWPSFLPDGKRFLYLSPRGAQSGIDLASLDDPKRTRRLVPDITNPEYVPPQPGSAVGHLLFVRGGTLMAQPVDPKTMDNRGELFPVAQQVSRGVLFGTNLYSVSATGTLVYLNRGGAGATTQHVWLDRTGKELEKVGGPVRSRNTFALSPDGKRVVVERIVGDEAGSDLWLTDIEHGGTETRFTLDASTNYYPVWAPDGSKVAFASNRNGGVFNLYQRPSNGAGQDELLFASKDPTKFPWDWSHDGRFLLFRATDSKNGLGIWALPVMGQGEKKALLVQDSQFVETQAQLSPDGRWLAYTSNESGNSQVYVALFAPAFDKPVTGKWQISAAGGTQPRWRGDGKELYYVTPDRKLMAVEVKAAAPSFDRGAPRALFELRSSIDASNAFLWGYVPSADGKRFLAAEIPGTTGDAPAPPLTVVVNWLGSVKK